MYIYIYNNIYILVYIYIYNMFLLTVAMSARGNKQKRPTGKKQ